MKKIHNGVLTLLVFTTALAFMPVSQAMAVDTETFSHKSPDFTMTVPQWTDQKSQNPDSVLRRLGNPAGLPVVEVAVSDPPKDMAYPNDLAKVLIKGLEDVWQGSNCKTLYEREIKLKDGTSAYELEVKWDHPAVQIYTYAVYVLKDKKLIGVFVSSIKEVVDELKQYPLSLTLK